jgi:hypothetical protein
VADPKPIDEDTVGTIEAVIIIVLFLVISHMLNYVCRGSQKPRYEDETSKP